MLHGWPSAEGILKTKRCCNCRCKHKKSFLWSKKTFLKKNKTKQKNTVFVYFMSCFFHAFFKAFLLKARYKRIILLIRSLTLFNCTFHASFRTARTAYLPAVPTHTTQPAASSSSTPPSFQSWPLHHRERQPAQSLMMHTSQQRSPSISFSTLL